MRMPARGMLSKGWSEAVAARFAPMALLPLMAADLHVTIPAAGMLVTGYALGVMLGAPVVTLVTLGIPRKLLLILLMGVFTAGNSLAFISDSYATLLAARLVTSLCHGAPSWASRGSEYLPWSPCNLPCRRSRRRHRSTYGRNYGRYADPR